MKSRSDVIRFRLRTASEKKKAYREREPLTLIPVIAMVVITVMVKGVAIAVKVVIGVVMAVFVTGIICRSRR